MTAHIIRKLLIPLATICLTLAAIVWLPPQNLARGQEVVGLPPPDRQGGMPLMQALANRRSTRSFSARTLSHEMLSNLLWAAFGVNRPGGDRTAPSAHNMQEISIYAALPDGLFLFDAQAHALRKVSGKDVRPLAGRQAFAAQAPLDLIYVADLSRMRDEEAQDFYAAADTGFISQNVYLFCASEGLATVVYAWIDREALADAMGLLPHQRIVLAQSVGWPP
ncbi:nitroreductase family protein [Desulfocurvibacter africanus]|uniref:nitroreductase family protein n=1 Tax=Desulfocurvibacter africanus TaxID=873 RepID=UPI0003F896EF|nr:SagB/ThcOx family dehydrogenase [Desulfocurvibacter africanus]